MEKHDLINFDEMMSYSGDHFSVNALYLAKIAERRILEAIKAFKNENHSKKPL